MIVGTHYNDSEYNVQVYDGNTFEYLHGRDFTDPGERDSIWEIATRKGWYEAAIAPDSPKIHFYNTKGNNLIQTVTMPSVITELAYRPDGKQLAAAARDNSNIYILYTDHQNGNRRVIRTLRAHTDRVGRLAWSSDGNILASAGYDGTVRLWNPNSGVNYAVLRKHKNQVYALAFSPDDSKLFSGSGDRTVCIWDINTRSLLRTININYGVVNVRFHPSKQILAVLGSYQPPTDTFGLYNPDTMKHIQTLPRADAYYLVAFHPSGQFLVTKSLRPRQDDIKIWKLISVNPLDVNKDGQVNLDDLVQVARNYGKTGTNNADVNNDNRVDVKDFIAVAKVVNPNFAAPTHAQEATTLPLTAQEVQQWIQDAKKLGVDAEGIATLEQLLQAILQQAAPPQETALLANYPNPFNPETWIPYQLAQPAEVTVSIHAADGKIGSDISIGTIACGCVSR